MVVKADRVQVIKKKKNISGILFPVFCNCVRLPVMKAYFYCFTSYCVMNIFRNTSPLSKMTRLLTTHTHSPYNAHQKYLSISRIKKIVHAVCWNIDRNPLVNHSNENF